MNIVCYNFVTVCLLFTVILTSVNSKIIGFQPYEGQFFRNDQSVNDFDVSSDSKPWIEVIAGTILKSFVLFSSLESDDDFQFKEQIINNSSLVVKGVSEFLRLYNRFIYDKLWTRKKLNGDHATTVIPVAEENSLNPKEQIEIVGSKYHGRLCDGKDGCELTAIETDDSIKEEVLIADEEEVTECPPGMMKVPDGQCISRMTQRFIMSVPKGCPTGYRQDRLGNCRRVFW